MQLLDPSFTHWGVISIALLTQYGANDIKIEPPAPTTETLIEFMVSKAIQSMIETFSREIYDLRTKINVENTSWRQYKQDVAY